MKEVGTYTRVRLSESSQICRDSIRLEGRLSKDVREPSGRERGSGFWDTLCSSNSSEVGTSRRECRLECRATLRLTTSNTTITGSEQNRGTKGTELHVSVAQFTNRGISCVYFHRRKYERTLQLLRRWRSRCLRKK